ncbi:MAG TPA: two-component regulator propeller domain-containing protein [Gemmatimonadales bacterium]
MLRAPSRRGGFRLAAAALAGALLVAEGELHGQASGASPDAAGPRRGAPPMPLLHEAWTVEDGLPVNGIQRVLQGPDSYLWLATWDGLVRFDGVRFTVYNTGNTDVLPSSRIIDLKAAADGSLWFRTEQNHLVRLWREGFTHFGAEHGVVDRGTRVLHVDADGEVWIGTDAGVRRLVSGRFVPVAEQAVRGAVESLLRDSGGTLWVGTQLDGLYRIAGGRVEHFDSTSALGRGRVTALAEGRGDGGLWIGTDYGLRSYRDGTLRRVARSDGSRFDQAVMDIRVAPSSGEAWVVTETSVLVVRDGRLETVAGTPGLVSEPDVRFDDTGTAWYVLGDRIFHDGRLVFMVPLRSPSEPRTTPLIQDFGWDHEGSLWIATGGSGLYRLKPSLFRVHSTAEGVAHHNIVSILEDREGGVWMGTLGRGFSHLAGGRVTSYTPDDGFPAFVLSLMQDSAGNLWAGTHQTGILHCRLPAMICGAPPGGQPLGGATVRALHQDASGDVWAGTEQGLFRLRRGAWSRMAGGRRESWSVRVFAEAPDGTLWMGSNGGGVLAFRGGRVTHVGTAEGLPSELVRALHLDARGYLWVGTEGRGLVRLTPHVDAKGVVTVSDPRVIRQRDGLFDEVVHTILEDDSGRLWMSTNRGIFWVSREQLDDFVEGRIPRIYSTFYTERDGLRNREANGGSHPAGLRGRDGRLWFATQDGAVVVDPAATRSRAVRPRAVVERLLSHGRAVRTDTGHVALGADERDFEIDYTALSFLAPENVRFRYRLEGLTEEWTEAGNRRTAFYTNVPPGDYTFRVLASSDDGGWSDVEASVGLRVEPYFHETRTARALLMVAVVLLMAAGFQWRLRALRRSELQLTRLVDERTAELRRHERELEERNAELARMHRARSRLFADLSHEFRTPLTLILGPLRSLLDGRHGWLEPGVREQHELMLRNAGRLLRRTNQILDLAKLEAESVVLEKEVRDLVGFARATTLAFVPLAEHRGIELHFQGGPGELPVAFDPEQLEKVLHNLLSNALKFTEPGGLVEVRVTAARLVAAVEVRDTGAGIAPGELARVFGRFTQADTPAAHRFPGTGIGLALARELVELHGGDIHVASTLGEGSSFVVTLPRDGLPVAAESAPSNGAGGDGGHGSALVLPGDELPMYSDDVPGEVGLATTALPRLEDADRTTVLVVDDESDVRRYVRSVLESSFRVLEAADGRTGLDIARAELPDLIVADVMMPGMDGLELGHALKDDAMTDAIPVVLLTARAASEDQVAGLASGADVYLVKPFDPAVLEATVSSQLAQRRRLRERFRTGEAAPPAAPSPAPPSALEARLRPLVTGHIHDSGFGPEELAAAASLSYHQLYRALRDELGVTPSRFIRGVRAECAAELLRQGAGTVTEIAYSVGFESLSYFRRAYRERFGVSPSEHRAATHPPRARR